MAVILYIDDEHINLKLFEINFGKTNKVFTARSGIEGLDILHKHPDISMVLCDMKMPIMNGIEFCIETKKIRTDLPLFLMTGYGLTEEIKDAIDHGIIEQFLKKPFDQNELLEAIASIDNSNLTREKQ